MGNCCSKGEEIEDEEDDGIHAKTPLLNNTTAEVGNDQLQTTLITSYSPSLKPTDEIRVSASVSITSQNEVTHQEKISTIIQTLLVNVKALLPIVEQLLVLVRDDATQLIQLLLAQREIRQSSKDVNLSIGGDRAALEGMEPIIRAVRVAANVMLKLEESIGHDMISEDGGRNSRGDKAVDPEPSEIFFVSKALGACSYQLFEAVNNISQTHIDPVAQFDMLNKAKGMRGSTVLLQLSITQKDQALADFHIALAAAARAFASSIVALVDSAVCGLRETPDHKRRLDTFTISFPQQENRNVWQDVGKPGIILYEEPQNGESHSKKIKVYDCKVCRYATCKRSGAPLASLLHRFAAKHKAATVNGLLLHLVATDKFGM